MTRYRPLLRGVPQVGSPASSLLLRHSDFPAPIGRRFVDLAPFLPRSLIRAREEASGPPRFLDNPCARALLYDPGGATAPDLSGRASHLVQRYCLPRSVARRPPRSPNISGLNHTAHAPAVYASRPRLPVYCYTATQDSLPVGGQPSPVGTFTRGLLREVSVDNYVTSSSPRLRLAHTEHFANCPIFLVNHRSVSPAYHEPGLGTCRAGETEPVPDTRLSGRCRYPILEAEALLSLEAVWARL